MGRIKFIFNREIKLLKIRAEIKFNRSIEYIFLSQHQTVFNLKQEQLCEENQIYFSSPSDKQESK
jgi:hypothetical protein